MTVIPRPGAEQHLRLRMTLEPLVEVKITGARQGTYKYDGLNRRIQHYSNTRDFYYSNK
jgi:hypothetical protein